MTSRSGITRRSYSVSVADRLDMRGGRRQCSRGLRRLNPLDDATQVVVADDLAMLAERDDCAVDEVEIGGGQREAERFAAALHGMPARVAAEHETRRGGLT